MTPLGIEILLWYHACTGDYDRPSPAASSEKEHFVELGLLVPCGVATIGDPAFAITERGRAYCRALCSVPLPENTWVIPAQERREVPHG